MSYQKNLIWFGNPFFLYFGCIHFDFDKNSAFTMKKKKKTYFPTALDVIETMLTLELKIHSRDEHIKITEKIKSYFTENKDFQIFFENHYMAPDLDFFDLFSDDRLSILNLTYIFSFYIACREKLRTKFYDAYQGKIPAITQFLLNSIRRGPIDENTYVSDIRFDTSYFFEIGTSFGGIETNFEEFCRPFLLTHWFKQLEMHCSNHKLFFHHFVNLKKVPLDSEETVLLTGFNQVNPQFLSIANEKLLAKKNYMLINQALNAFLVEENYYKKHDWPIHSDDSRILGGGENPKKWIFFDEIDNYESPLMAPLLDFIIHCYPDNC